MGTCNNSSTSASYSTNVNLHTGTNEMAGDILATQDTESKDFDCSECYQLKALGIFNGECTCGEEYVGCISSLSITNSLIRVESESIELTFDYEVGLTEEVAEESYLLIKISSASWTDEAHTVFIVSSGNSTASGSKTVVLTDIADSLDSTIQVKFRR